MGDLNDLKTRLMAKVTKAENGCWIFLGAPRGGYGAIKLDGKVIGAHVASFMVHKGPVSSDRIVMHSCDHAMCVNPDHLSLGTKKQNAQDAIDKGIIKPFRPTRDKPLTDAEIAQIKSDYDRGVSSNAISRKYDIPRTSNMRLLGRTK